MGKQKYPGKSFSEQGREPEQQTQLITDTE